MSAKKIAIGKKPATTPAPASADAWVENSHTPATSAKMKRLTIDIPDDLHKAIKSQCAMRGAKIADEIRALLLQKYSIK